MNFRLFYHNPISGKRDFLYTTCVLCGKRVSLNRKNIRKSQFGHAFYYCNDKKRHEVSSLSTQSPMLTKLALILEAKTKYEMKKIEVGPISSNLNTSLKIKISLSDKLACQICEEEIAIGEAIYLSGFGKVIEEKEDAILKIKEINVSHRNCICEELDDYED